MLRRMWLGLCCSVVSLSTIGLVGGLSGCVVCDEIAQVTGLRRCLLEKGGSGLSTVSSAVLDGWPRTRALSSIYNSWGAAILSYGAWFAAAALLLLVLASWLHLRHRFLYENGLGVSSADWDSGQRTWTLRRCCRHCVWHPFVVLFDGGPPRSVSGG